MLLAAGDGSRTSGVGFADPVIANDRLVPAGVAQVILLNGLK
jgi:hypothetical protein